MRRTAVEVLEARRLLTLVAPAFADRIGLNGVVDYNTTFEDNFDGTSLDRGKWQVRQGPRWRQTPNGPLSGLSYTGEDSILVRNGNLELVAFTDPATGQNRSAYIQTGSAFRSRHPDNIPEARLASGYWGNFEQAYGYWEARLKMSSMPGMWNAFWVHSYGMVDVENDPNKVNHPEIYGAEYDLVENAAVRQGAPAAHQASTAIHANGYADYHRATAVHTTTSGYGPSYSNPDQFHVYGLLWTPDTAKFYIDGNLIHTVTDPMMVSKVAQVAILSNEIGAGGALFPDDGSNFFGYVPSGGYGSRDTSNARLVADYVRVWKLSNVGNAALGSVSGVVFSDDNGNGTRDSGEAGLAGRTVYIDSNWNNYLDGTERRATTNASGEYAIVDVATGSYPVRQVVTSGTQTAPASNASIISFARGSRAILNFGVGGLNAVGGVVEGRVVKDANANGVVETTEAGVANINVYLDYNNNGRREDAEPQVLTNSSGAYRLVSTQVGSLQVRTNLDASQWIQTAPTWGGHWIWLNNGSSVSVLPFGIRPTVIQSNYAIISGIVYNDSNRNGRRDTGEAGRSGVQVFIDLNANGRIDANELVRTTAWDGSYRFEQVTPGNTPVTIVRPTNLTLSAPTGGTYWLWSQANQTYVDRDFGLYEPTPGARITGTVYLDTNWNGSRQDGEGGLAGVRVYLDSNYNGVFDNNEPSVLTPASGDYVFQGVPAGVYVARVVLPSGFAQVSPTNRDGHWLRTTDGAVLSGRNFGLGQAVTPASTNTISGTVWGDWIPNGRKDTGEPGLAWISVYLDYNGNGRLDSGEPQQTTNSQGYYRFEAVRTGYFAIRLDLTGRNYAQTSPGGNNPYWVSFTSGMVLTERDFLVQMI